MSNMNKFKHNDDGTTTIFIEHVTSVGTLSPNKKSTVFECLIDTEDWDRVKKYNWHIKKKSSSHSGYRIISKNACSERAETPLSRFVTGQTLSPKRVFYKNQDNWTDNRKANILVPFLHQSQSVRDVDKNTKEFTIESIKYGSYAILIDAEDWNKVNKYIWSLAPNSKSGFTIVGKQAGHRVSLPKLVTDQCDSKFRISYKDRNKWTDNRKDNIVYLGSHNVKDIDENTKQITMYYRLENSYHDVLIDAEDWDLFAGGKWWLNKDRSVKSKDVFYLHGKTPTKTSFHRNLLNAPKDKLVDHINGNTLDNRKSNLRLCTAFENARNVVKKMRNGKASSKYKGVHRHNDGINPYQAAIMFNRKQNYIGLFPTEEEAARAYDKKAKELYGEFAYLNFPEEHDDVLS